MSDPEEAPDARAVTEAGASAITSWMTDPASLHPLSPREARGLLCERHGAEPARVNELCELVDRLPDGITLVAEKLHTHSPAKLLARFGGRAHRLRDRDGARPLEEALRSQLDGCAPTVRAVARAASVFEGCFLAEDVGELVEEAAPAIRAALLALRDRELAYETSDGFRLLRLLRDYLRGQRGAPPERAHTALFARRARGWLEGYDRAGHAAIQVALRRYADDLTRAHAALERSAGEAPSGSPEPTWSADYLALATAIERLLRQAPRPALEAALARTVEALEGDPAAQAKALLLVAWSALLRGGDGEAAAWRAHALSADDPPAAAEAEGLALWCRVCHGEGAPATVARLEALAAADDTPPRARAEALAAAARAELHAGRYDAAEGHYRAAIRRMEACGVTWRVALLWTRVGGLEHARGALAASQAAFKRALGHAEAQGDEGTASASRVHLARLDAERAAPGSAAMREAFARIMDEVERMRRVGSRRDVAFVLASAAQVALLDGTDATVALEAALALVEDDPVRRSRFAALLAAARAATGDPRARATLAAVAPADRGLARRVEACLDGGPVDEPSDVHSRVIARAFATRPAPGDASPRVRTQDEVAVDASHLSIAGRAVALPRSVVRRALRSLVRAHLVEPTSGVDPYALFDEVWPDEPHAEPERMTSRVYVAVHELRALSAGPIVISDDGYRLAPNVRVGLPPERDDAGP